MDYMGVIGAMVMYKNEIKPKGLIEWFVAVMAGIYGALYAVWDLLKGA